MDACPVCHGTKTVKCDKCGGSLEDGYEIREFGRDAEGYADEEIVCAVCIEAEKPKVMLVIAGDPSHVWDAKAGNDFTECFFQHPERVQIESITYSEAAQWRAA